MRRSTRARPPLCFQPSNHPPPPPSLPACSWSADYLGRPLSALTAFPHFVSYSLDRIAPRAAASRHLVGTELQLSRLALTNAAFARWCGLEGGEVELHAFTQQWWRGEEGQAWAPLR